MDSAIVSKRQHKVQTSLDRQTKAALRTKAERAGHSISSYLRTLVHADLGRTTR